ncbi:MAG TPA: DUF2398 family protein [Trebonia sp.]|nr:DUF2398 family protein [Trebonia sp.]
MPVAASVPASDLGAYQQAARLVLTHDLITASRPRPGALEAVLRWADQLTADLRDVLGYVLIATTRQVRLIRRLDVLDDTQTTIFAKNGRPFDRRRLAYLCLILASFQRSRVEVSLADLVRALTPQANAIDGLAFDATVTAHKAAVVDVVDWLVERGALRLSDGSAESWAQDSERGDALYDIDHDIASALFRPARPVQHLTSAAGLLDATLVSAKARAQREAAAQQAARALIEYPVVYFAQVQPEVTEALRTSAVADNLARLTGLAIERRAEGVLLADSSGRFTDKPFPGRGGAVNRAAGLLLAKIADAIEDRSTHLAALPLPSDTDDQRELLAKIDSALPTSGIVRELAWVAPIDSQAERSLPPAAPAPSAPDVPLVEASTLGQMIDELFDELGAASFTITWQHDPRGLLEAAVGLLSDLRLLRRVPGGVLVLPAAARFRNIKLALPISQGADSQLALDFSAAE